MTFHLALQFHCFACVNNQCNIVDCEKYIFDYSNNQIYIFDLHPKILGLNSQNPWYLSKSNKSISGFLSSMPEITSKAWRWNRLIFMHHFSSVTQSCSTLCDPMNQHVRPPCPSPTSGVHTNSCPSSQWYHPAISSSVIPFSSCLPALGSFPMSQLFTCGGQSIGVSASASVLPKNTQDWSPLRWTVGSPWSSRDSQESSPTPQFKSINSSVLSLFHSPTLTSIHDHWKNHSMTRQTFFGKVMSLLFNMISRLVITFLPGSNRLLISWLHSPSKVILETQKIKSDTVSTVSPSIPK